MTSAWHLFSKSMLDRLMDLRFKLLFRKQWVWGQQPHFFDHRHDLWGLMRGRTDPLVFARGFYAAEAIQPDDDVLDIGCGDGFFTSRFFAPRAKHVDAIDVEPTAIAHARRHYSVPNVKFAVGDALTGTFPRDRYSVVVWDGGLGHLTEEDAIRLIERISQVTRTFCGSEALGHDGDDHLQTFASTDDIQRLLDPFFENVTLRTIDYSGRTEVLWRCDT